jgi:hypothetical protein
MDKPLFEFLFQPGEAIEVRVVAPWNGSGFFDNAADLEAALSELDGLKPDAVYCSLNPVTREAFERAPNEFRRAVKGQKLACNKEDIARRAWILIDFDPVRPKGTSATDAEKEAALSKMREARDYLLSEGAPPAIEADSGNGGHLLLACDLPNDETSTRLVRGFLDFLSARFTDDRVKVDRVNFNADRITKAYGTWARKGPDTPERPHRQSRIISLPPQAEPVSRALLEKLQFKPLKVNAQVSGIGEEGIRKLKEWASTIPDFPAIKQIKHERDKVTVIPERCYLNADHEGTSAGIVFHADGGRGNVCKHDGCSLPFKDWWAEVEKLYGCMLPFDPQAVIGKAKSAKTWTLQNFSQVQVEGVSWVFQGYLALGKPTALVGEPGEGKSLTTVDWSARITTGRGFPDGVSAILPHSSVLMMNSEDAAGDTIKPRFLAAGGDSERLFQILLPSGVRFRIDNEDDVRQLGQQLIAHPEIRCLVIDPVLQHVDSEKEQDVRRGVANILALIRERKVALLYAAHFNKVAGKNLSSPLDKLSGAKAWSGLPRFVLAVMKGIKTDDLLGKPRHHLVLGKTNLGSLDRPTMDFTIETRAVSGLNIAIDPPPVIRWLGESRVTMRELLERRTPKKPKEEATEEEVATLLHGELLNQPRPASDIYRALEDMGIKKRRVEKAKALLILNGKMAKPENIGGSWYWRLPDAS